MSAGAGSAHDPVVVWLREDLRLEDNPALQAALDEGRPVVPIFIWAPEEETPWAPGGASRWWLHQSLVELGRALGKRGSRLVIRKGPSLPTLREVLAETGARSVVWNRRYEPSLIERDTAIKAALREEGCAARSFNGSLLREPWEIRTGSDTPYRVYTPFYKRFLSDFEPAPEHPLPKHFPAPRTWPDGLAPAELGLEPTVNWATGIRDTWSPGEDGAEAELERFLTDGLTRYAESRERPDRMGTSRLSPHLHFGEISPHRVWRTVSDAASALSAGDGAAAYLRQLVWREFAHHLLFHEPQTTLEPLRPEFARFPWLEDARALRAWQKGRTGYPIVDAGMRELWTTGWMHNRVRMIVASFLVKHLLISWVEGARWFWDTLVDADLANNTMGWQWVAGSGADAAPYFRIFNPMTQGGKFDPDGGYVRKWVPELAKLGIPAIHQPWTASATQLAGGGVVLGKTYPHPMVDHRDARERALAAYSETRS